MADPAPLAPAGAPESKADDAGISIAISGETGAEEAAPGPAASADVFTFTLAPEAALPCATDREIRENFKKWCVGWEGAPR